MLSTTEKTKQKREIPILSSGKTKQRIAVYLLATVNVLFPVFSFAQTFEVTVGGTGSEFAQSMVQTTDGGYALGGSTASYGAGSYDFYIVKLYADGTLHWTKTVECGSSSYEVANSIVQTTDGGYAIAGGNYPIPPAIGSSYIVKLDAAGALQWKRDLVLEDLGCWGGIAEIIQTTDGGYAVVLDECLPD